MQSTAACVADLKLREICSVLPEVQETEPHRVRTRTNRGRSAAMKQPNQFIDDDIFHPAKSFDS